MGEGAVAGAGMCRGSLELFGSIGVMQVREKRDKESRWKVSLCELAAAWSGRQALARPAGWALYVC